MCIILFCGNLSDVDFFGLDCVLGVVGRMLVGLFC